MKARTLILIIILVAIGVFYLNPAGHPNHLFYPFYVINGTSLEFNGPVETDHIYHEIIGLVLITIGLLIAIFKGRGGGEASSEFPTEPQPITLPTEI